MTWEEYQSDKFGEYFQLPDGKMYNVTFAQYLAQKKSVVEVDVEELARQCGFDRDPVSEQDGYLFFQAPGSYKVSLYEDHLYDDLDVEKPVLLSQDAIFDGLHRLYLAFVSGMKKMNGYLFSSEEMGQIASVF